MMTSPSVLKRILGRETSLFHEATRANADRLRKAISSSRVLVIGAGGSIGSAFVKTLIPYAPAALHLVELNENALVALVRDLHAEGGAPRGEFATYAIGFDEPEFAAFLRARGPFDYVLNFAALKHVRSERDPFTAMRMLRVNVLANRRLVERLAPCPPRRFFCVSSDKAVNPASLMGASKAFMERVGLHYADRVSFSSARFANVAFSAGSLLASFVTRLRRGQPLAAPTDVRRYFISEAEAGELCLLGCFCGRNREIFIPQLRAREDLKTFSEIAEIMLEEQGLRPRYCATAAEAVALARTRRPGDPWPCVFAPSNTSGEKPFEEFSGADEEVEVGRYPGVSVVVRPRQTPPEVLEEALNELTARRASGGWTKEDLVATVRRVTPEFQHVERHADLDHKL